MDHVERNVAARDFPYHGTAIDVADCQTADEVLEATKLPARISSVPATATLRDGRTVELKRFKVPVREDTGEPLDAIVGKGFTFTQNEWGLRAMQPLVDSKLLQWDKVSVFGDGELIVATLRARSSDFELLRSMGADAFEASVITAWAHDGSRQWIGGGLLKRLWCLNAMLSAYREGRRKGTWFGFRHTRNVHDKIGDARRIVHKAITGFGQEKQLLQGLANQPMDRKAMLDFGMQLITGKNKVDDAYAVLTNEKTTDRVRANLERRVAILVDRFYNGKGNHGHDALDALNAVTEWVDWGYGSKAAEDALQLGENEQRGILVELSPAKQQERLKSSLFGTGAELKERARELLAARFNLAA